MTCQRFAIGITLSVSCILASFTQANCQHAPSLVNNPDSPIQFVSIRSTGADFLDAITVKNGSNREIDSFEFGAIMASPAPCGPKETYSSERLMRAERLALSPGATSSLANYRLAPAEVRSFAKDNLATAVHVQIAVVSVRYSDGGFWFASPHGSIYDKRLMDNEANVECSKGGRAKTIRASIDR